MSNEMRQVDRQLTPNEQTLMAKFKALGQAFHDALDIVVPSRESALAKTKIEEAVMWATKHITR